MEKPLEGTQIKLSVVASDIFRVSGREMMSHWRVRQTNPQVLAQLTRGQMRATITQPDEAFTGHFIDHHALLTKMLARIDVLDGHLAPTVGPQVRFHDLGAHHLLVHRICRLTGVDQRHRKYFCEENHCLAARSLP